MRGLRPLRGVWRAARKMPREWPQAAHAVLNTGLISKGAVLGSYLR